MKRLIHSFKSLFIFQFFIRPKTAFLPIFNLLASHKIDSGIDVGEINDQGIGNKEIFRKFTFALE
jgi:hypothetical protein